MLSMGLKRSREVLRENGCCFWWKSYVKILRIINETSIAESDSISSIGSKLMCQIIIIILIIIIIITITTFHYIS